MLDTYDFARLEGYAGTREEFQSLRYLRNGVNVEKMQSQSTAAAMALLEVFRGDTGPVGPRGATGLDLYQLALQAGFGGTLDEYLASLNGDTGPRGEKGDAGPKGEKGIQGDRGADGVDGSPGAIPRHEIEGTRIRFVLPDGSWGKWLELGNSGGQSTSMGAGSLSIQKFYDSFAEFPVIGKSQLLYFDSSSYTAYIWDGSQYQALSAGSAASTTDWGHYSLHWSTAPVSVGTVAAGTVMAYTLGSTTTYRLVPSPYDATADAFYSTFAAGVLSGVLAVRG